MTARPQVAQQSGLTDRGRTAAAAIRSATDVVDTTVSHLITADELHRMRAGLAAYRVVRVRPTAPSASGPGGPR